MGHPDRGGGAGGPGPSRKAARPGAPEAGAAGDGPRGLPVPLHRGHARAGHALGPGQLDGLVSPRGEAPHPRGAHWDIRPWADEDPDPARRSLPFDGANDGVSGTVVLLELARELSREPPPEGVGVDLVFFDGEEGPRTRPITIWDPRTWRRTGRRPGWRSPRAD